jgi:peptide/nickel transport system permease protein
MLATLARRLALSIPLVLIVTAISFILVGLLPGTAAITILGSNATPAEIAALNRQLGLNKPIWDQYWQWLSHLMHGNLGVSSLTGTSVAANLNSRLGVTLSLVLGAMAVTLILGVALGVFTALRRGVFSRTIDTLAIAGLAIPSFWLALILIFLFSVRLRILPSIGYVSPGTSLAEWSRSLVLPVAALALSMITTVAKQTRDSMLQALSSPFVVSLRANGISERRIIFKHALRNAGIPIVTVSGLLFINSLTGAVFIEQIFVLPGLGSAVVSATSQRDIPTVQGVALYLTLLVVAANVVVDLAYAALNPKVRARS